jgi:hypothetical protein
MNFTQRLPMNCRPVGRTRTSVLSKKIDID